MLKAKFPQVMSLKSMLVVAEEDKLENKKIKKILGCGIKIMLLNHNVACSSSLPKAVTHPKPLQNCQWSSCIVSNVGVIS